MTPVETLSQTGGVPSEVAERLARALDLPTCADVSSLTEGQVKTMALAHALIHDPDVLVLIRPFGQFQLADRTRLQLLLRAWQDGGSQRLLWWLCGKIPEHTADARLARRTVVITAEDMVTR